MSGTASIGSPDNAYRPATIRRAAAMRTIGRCARLPSMMRWSMASVLVREHRLAELGLEDEAPFGHDLFSRLHAREDLGESLERVAGLHEAPREGFGARPDEERRPALERLKRRLRNGRRASGLRCGFGNLDLAFHEHPRLEPA